MCKITVNKHLGGKPVLFDSHRAAFVYLIGAGWTFAETRGELEIWTRGASVALLETA